MSESLGEGEAEVRFGRPWMSREGARCQVYSWGVVSASHPPSLCSPGSPGGGPELTERNKLANVPGYLSAKVVSIGNRPNLRCQKNPVPFSGAKATRSLCRAWVLGSRPGSFLRGPAPSCQPACCSHCTGMRLPGWPAQGAFLT